MKKHGLSVEVQASHDELTLSDDQATLLYHSVRELLLNVIKHAQTHEATVSLSVSEERMLTISVQDGGRGFDVGSLEGQPPGDHFGLLSVMERMEALGGGCEINSSGRQGTTVSLRLPLADRAARDPALTVPASRLTRQVRSGVKPGEIRKVLLVDDHAMVREGLGSILARYVDVRVIGEASNGVEAVAMAAELAPDVIVMDINMPQMDGIEATKRIITAQPWAIIIGLSVNNSPQTAEAMKNAGAATLLSKEAAGDELYDAIVALVPP